MILQLTEDESQAVQEAVITVLYEYRLYDEEKDKYVSFKNPLESVHGDFIRDLRSAVLKMDTP